MLRKASVIKCFFLFILAFGLQQIVTAFSYISPSYEWLQYIIFLMVICISILIIKAEGASFREYGFLMPEGVSRYFWASLFLAVFYVFVIIFLPGSVAGLEAFPPVSISLNLFLMTVSILLSSIAAETIFRGYIQTSLTNAYGFSKALIISSIMFTLYMLLMPFYVGVTSTTLFYNAISLFAESVFLCFLFKKTKTLLCPIIYSASVTLLYTFTPLKPISSEYAIVFLVIPYIFFVPLVYFLRVERVGTV
jgi:membrane protease YdiL (CAAX protease family)